MKKYMFLMDFPFLFHSTKIKKQFIREKFEVILVKKKRKLKKEKIPFESPKRMEFVKSLELVASLILL